VLASWWALDLPELPPHAWPYLEVRVLLDAPEPGLRAQVEAAMEGKPVRLAKIEPTRSRHHRRRSRPCRSTSWRSCSRTTSSAACGSSASARMRRTSSCAPLPN
jgi:hypothetical protein